MACKAVPLSIITRKRKLAQHLLILFIRLNILCADNELVPGGSFYTRAFGVRASSGTVFFQQSVQDINHQSWGLLTSVNCDDHLQHITLSPHVIDILNSPGSDWFCWMLEIISEIVSKSLPKEVPWLLSKAIACCFSWFGPCISWALPIYSLWVVLIDVLNYCLQCESRDICDSMLIVVSIAPYLFHMSDMSQIGMLTFQSVKVVLLKASIHEPVLWLLVP